MNTTIKWKEGQQRRAYWAALATNYIKANKHRIEGSSDYYRDWEKLRLDAHDKYNLRLSRERNPDRKMKSLKEEGPGRLL